MIIQAIKGREILDSRGNPTIEADVTLTNGTIGRASVPSGASTGSLEAFELRDQDRKRYHGKGVLNAVSYINQDIAAALRHASVADQALLDTTLCELDGTANKSRIGANAMLAVSLAAARARAAAQNIPLVQALNSGEPMVMPVPMMNILNGGAHADNNVDIQEFMIMPLGAPDFANALRMGAEIFHGLKSLLKQRHLNTAVGDEGGLAPNLRSNREALDLLSTATEQAGFTLGQDIVFALDVAASELFHEGQYTLASEHRTFSSAGFVEYYQSLLADYPIVSIEDGLHESDWDGWQMMTRTLPHIQLVADDLFVTNTTLLQKGIDLHAANAILIKLNQIGTLTETLQTMRLARTHGYSCVVSHRSGETEDTFIADLAVATGCGQIKTGSLCRSDRVAKYNQLLRIQELMALPYAGRSVVRG